MQSGNSSSTPPVSGLGGLSSLSTLGGLLDSAATFKPKVEEEQQRHRGGDGFNGKGRRDDNRYDEPFRGARQGRAGGGWKGERETDFSNARRNNPESLTKSFQPRDGVNSENALRVNSDSIRGNRSSTSTPGTMNSPPSTSHSSPTARTTGVTPATTGVTPATPATVESARAESPAVPAKEVSAPQPWRPRRSADPTEQLKRDVNGMLNKLTIENFPSIAERLAVLTSNLKKPEELELVLEWVLDKAFNEPDFSELYADLCLILSYRCPSFDVIIAAGKPTLFSSLLIQKWREAFEKIPATVELTEAQKFGVSHDDQEIMLTKIKTRIRGLCVCLSEFVVRRMVGMRGFNVAASVLLAREEPEEHYMEGMCQMISTAGAFLDEDPMGKCVVENCFGRLQELKAKGVFSKRICCIIQDLVDARAVGWHKKIHKEKAKGLTKIKEEQENADLVGGSVVLAQYGTVVKLGQRSNLMGNNKYSEYLEEQETQFKKKGIKG